MKAEIKDGSLVITVPLENEPRRSSTGRSQIVASTGGFIVSEAMVAGRKVAVSVNAIIRSTK